MNATPLPTARRPADVVERTRWQQLGADYAYVLAGFPLAVMSFAVLVSLTTAAVATAVVWVGALLMPVTLLLASAFAAVSRRRVRTWSGVAVPGHYQPVRPGLGGTLRIMADTRRWLDLAFEALLTLPLRMTTFVVAISWTATALGGLTFWFWGVFIPGRSGWVELLQLRFPDLLPGDASGAYLLEAGLNLAIGLIFALTLPAVMRGLARLDAGLTAALLANGGAEPGPAWAGGEDDATVRVRGGDSQEDDGEGPPDPAHAHPTRGASPTLSSEGWAWISVAFVAVALVAVGWPVMATLYDLHPALAMVLTVSHSAAAVLAVRWAWAGIGLAGLVVAGAMAATHASAAVVLWPWPVTMLLTQCLLVIVIALRHRWSWAVAAWSTGALLSAGAFVLLGHLPAGSLANTIVLVSVSAGLTLLGVLERLLRRSTSRAQQAEELSAEEASRRRDLEERNRIARELHDVVAHSMSVINVQASTAQFRKPGIDPAIQEEFEEIAQSSRQALGEMRSLLALLRNDDAVPTAPAPTLTEVPDLIESTRNSGTPINYSVQADAPGAVGLTAYRIIQEALSNALRHAPGAHIEVTTTQSEDGRALRVSVVNSVPRREPAAFPAAGAGLGLAGIRERVAALRGTIEAGPTADGGFSVVATLPLDGSTDVGPNGAA